MGILYIIISLILISFFCFKDFPLPLSTLICSVVLLVLCRMNVYEGLASTYMGGFASFVQRWFLLFLFGNILGKILVCTGASDSLANSVLDLVGVKRVLLGIMIVSFIFTVAGISVYCTLFIVLPIAKKMCKRANISRIFIIGAYTLGINAALALPYVAVTNNILCTTYFGTEISAGGILSVFVTILYTIGGYLWLKFYEKRCAIKGIGYEGGSGATERIAAAGACENEETKSPHWVLTLLPCIVPLITINVWHLNVEYSLLCGIAAAIICLFPYLPKRWEPIKKLIIECISETGTTVINTSAVVGFGTIVCATSGYALAAEKILSINGDPLVVAMLATTLLAGVVGSSSSGIILASPILTQLAAATNASALHRTVVYASLGLDSLPNCGFIATENNLAGVKFSEAYLPMSFMISVVGTLLQSSLYILLCKLFGIA